MLTKGKPRIILIVVFVVLAIGAIVLPLRLFQTSTALPISQIAMGSLMGLIPLADFALSRPSATTEQDQAVVSGIPMRVAVGLSFVFIGVSNLTNLSEVFMPISCVVMLMGMLGGFYMSARIRLRTDPPPAGAGLLARMGLTIWEVIIIAVFTLGAAYVVIFGLPRNIGRNPEEVIP